MTKPKTDKAAPRKAGRPRDPAKYNAIIEAARAAFFARGFHSATIDDIAQAAGVSKVTVYSRFGDKETLFEEVIRTENARMTQMFEAEMASGQDLEAQLNGFGLVLAGFKFSEEHVAVDRVLLHEIALIPELAQRFIEAGPRLCMSRLTEVISEAAARGEIEVDDPALAADDLIGLWLGAGDLEIKLGVAPLPDEQTVRRRVTRATRLFLKMVGSNAR